MNVLKTLGTAQLIAAQDSEFGKVLFLEFGDTKETSEFVGYLNCDKIELNTRPYMGAGETWNKAQRILKLMGLK